MSLSIVKQDNDIRFTACIQLDTPTGPLQFDYTATEELATHEIVVRSSYTLKEAALIDMRFTYSPKRRSGVIAIDYGDKYFDGLQKMLLQHDFTNDGRKAVVSGSINDRVVIPYAFVKEGKCGCEGGIGTIHFEDGHDVTKFDFEMNAAVKPALTALEAELRRVIPIFTNQNIEVLFFIPSWACKLLCTGALTGCLALCPETGPVAILCVATCSGIFNACWDEC